MDTFKTERTIEAMVNRTVKGKVPAGYNWNAYHKGFRHEKMTPYQMAVNVYRGWAFCPVHKGARRQNNFTAAWHIGFDFDSSSIDDVAALTWVDDFASFLYTTPSHTEDNPKCRGVFIFDRPITDTTDYRDLYHALAWRFKQDGIETDPACKDVLRLYYGSPGCHLVGLWGVLPEAAQGEFVRQWRAAVPVKPRPAARPQYAGLPETVDEAKIRAALERIPAWGDYGDWCTVLMAVHSVMPGDAGVALCEAWSPGKPGEIARKFDGFNGDGVNIGSLFHLAKQYGYQQPARQQSKQNSGHYDLRSQL